MVGYSPQGHKESGTTERLHFHLLYYKIQRTCDGICCQPLVLSQYGTEFMCPRECLWDRVHIQMLHNTCVPQVKGVGHLLLTSVLRVFVYFS